LATRSYADQPGGSGNVWNTPLGNACTWGIASDADTQDLRHGGAINSAANNGTVVWVSQSASNPTATLTGSEQNYETGNTVVTVTAHLVPGSYSAGPHPTGSQTYSFFDTVGHPGMCYAFAPVDVSAFQAGQGPYTTTVGSAEDATSDTFATDWETGHGGMCTAAGVIRGYDLDPARNLARIPGTTLPRIQHMLRYLHDQIYFKSNLAPPDPAASPFSADFSIDFGAAASNYPAGGKLNPSGWPSLYQDWQQAGMTYVGNLLYGTTVGIPSNVTRPAGLTNAGIQLWDVLQTYGAIPRGSASGGFHLSCDQDVSANSTWLAQANQDLPTIVQFLCPLRNQHQGGQNYATHPINGPGSRLDAGPPPLAALTTTQTESADKTVITLACGGSIIDSAGTAWMLTSAGQITANGTVDPVTNNVLQLAYVNHVVWQYTGYGLWYSWSPTSHTWAGTSVSPLPTPQPVSSRGSFVISDGVIIAPDGKAFCGRGLNIDDAEMLVAASDATCAPLTTLFPGINIVRVACYSYQPPSYYDTFVSRCTAAGIVVVLENHQTSDGSNAGNAAGVVFTGAQLAAESSWYANLASAYARNPWVWLGTANEPSYSPSIAALSSWHQATYNAIRTSGAANLILINLPGGGAPGTYGSGRGMTASVYAAMTGICWDFHQYAWIYGGHAASISQASIQTAMQSSIATAKTLKSVDGIVPVFAGEYGLSGRSPSVDLSGNQLVAAVQALAVPRGSLAGCAAWHWASADAVNSLTTTEIGGALTAYGSTAAAYIANPKVVIIPPAPPASAPRPPPERGLGQGSHPYPTRTWRH
jgi:hypothetical protein